MRSALLRQLYRAERVLRALSLTPYGRDTLAHQFERRAARHPQRSFLRFEGRSYSYGEANAEINRHAHTYAALGIGRGDVVALMMENRPEFLWHVLALHKLGAAASLINTQLTGDVLVHALDACDPKRVVIGAELWPSFAPIRGRLAPALAQSVCSDAEGGERTDCDAIDFPAQARNAAASDPATTAEQELSALAAYIYTSGTTGLPKPAIIKHSRMFQAGLIWSSLALDYRPGDVMYNCLPLYHSNALILATGSAISAGVGLALARKFSRRQFWDDIQRHEATAFIYIGELCRYLLSAEPSPREREHKLRVVTGNGLRPEIWREFKQRFGVARVAEFYASTEGNCVTINFFNREGTVGPRLPGMRLARVDPATQELARGADGFLQHAAPGEPGILLGRINRRLEFSGYRNAQDSERKIIRDAFERGDAYFNTGDLLRMDRLHHLYFVDRLGDTFRWKGENVSTGEVESQLAKWPPAAEVNVYGVQVPGAEGRAGMAAVALAEGAVFDPIAFRAHVDANLPAYARPLFVRLPRALSTTATFKLKKGDLQREGFDPAASADPLYMRHPELDQYVPLDRELFARLAAGELKL